MLLFLYNLILLPILLPYLAWRLLVRGKSREGLAERFGRLPALGPAPPAGRVWVHAVSMGEAVAAAPVVAALREALPGVEVLVSTTTPTGQAQARRDLPEAALHFYFPIDLPWVTRRVMARLRPSVIVLMEAEIWPNLLAAAGRQGTPVVVANGHISDRTLRRARRLKPLLAPLIARIARYLAQSPAIRDRALALGFPADEVIAVGHTKFDQQVPALTSAEEAAVRAGFGLEPQQPVFLAGSTHEGEEELILEAWQAARTNVPELALMLAPRHLARVEAIRTLIERCGLTARARSEQKNKHGDAETRRGTAEESGRGEEGTMAAPAPCDPPLRGTSENVVLLLDTMGELARFYGLAAVVFVGGSLVPRGGHDILQPLFHGVPTLFGPHMHNQRALAELALSAGAARQVEDVPSLTAALTTLLEDRAERTAMATATGRLLAENRGAAVRCAAIVAELVRQNDGSTRSSRWHCVPPWMNENRAGVRTQARCYFQGRHGDTEGLGSRGEVKCPEPDTVPSAPLSLLPLTVASVFPCFRVDSTNQRGRRAP